MTLTLYLMQISTQNERGISMYNLISTNYQKKKKKTLSKLFKTLTQVQTLKKTSGTWQTEVKIIKLGDIQPKSMCTAKEELYKVKTQPTEWKMVKDDYPGCIKSSRSKQNKDIVKKWAKDMNRHFSKGEMQMTNRSIRKYKRSSAYKGNTNKYHGKVLLHTS